MRRLEGRIKRLEANVSIPNVCSVLTYDPRKTTALAALAQYGVPGVRYMLVRDYGTDAEWADALRDQQRRLKQLVRQDLTTP